MSSQEDFNRALALIHAAQDCGLNYSEAVFDDNDDTIGVIFARSKQDLVEAVERLYYLLLQTSEDGELDLSEEGKDVPRDIQAGYDEALTESD